MNCGDAEEMEIRVMSGQEDCNSVLGVMSDGLLRSPTGELAYIVTWCGLADVVLIGPNWQFTKVYLDRSLTRD